MEDLEGTATTDEVWDRYEWIEDLKLLIIKIKIIWNMNERIIPRYIP